MALFYRKKFRYSFFYATFIIAAINVLIFILCQFGLTIGSAKYPLEYILSLNPINVINRRWYWQFISSAFLHTEGWHLAINMLCLLMFGLPVERRVGSKEFLFFYIFTSFIIGILTFLGYRVTNNLDVFVMGASGVLMAIDIVFAVFFPDTRVFIFYILPLRAPVAMLVVIIMNYISMLASLRVDFSDISYICHLSGSVVGYLYSRIRYGRNFFHYLF